MGRWTGSWLSGPGAAGIGESASGRHRGDRLGLPAAGPGSVSGFGPRLGAFLVDSVIANLMVGLVYFAGIHPGPGSRGQLVLGGFLLQELVLVAAVGSTVGMRMFGIRVGRVDGGRPTLLMAVLRTALLSLLVPALVWDADGRGMHDRSSGTVVVRA